MILDNCTESCGYVAAIAAAFCLGSFGVPVKSEVVKRLDVDPLVMQSYKTTLCFLMSSPMVMLLGERPRFTHWGILSGVFWVPGGAAGIYGIRKAGLAVAVGTWSSLVVLTSFFWGIHVFGERVKSPNGAAGACLTLILGLIGMANFSSKGKPKKKEKDICSKAETLIRDSTRDLESQQTSTPKKTMKKNAAKNSDITPNDRKVTKVMVNKRCKTKVKRSSSGVETCESVDAPPSSTNSIKPLEMEALLVNVKAKDPESKPQAPEQSSRIRSKSEGRSGLTQRQLGLLAACFNGLWGGTSLIPLHFAAHEGFGGPSYMWSFACGSMIVNVCLWIARFAHGLYRLDGDLDSAWESIPSFHLKQMWLEGVLMGALYSCGNFCSIIAVTYLGQGVGYSFIQSSMLVSGLWGIFKFREIEGRTMVVSWLISACVAILGILWLTYEHAS
mmetsp:Transcript_7158/g.16617  ORF Transcript_7158/g.16617 Transcript_7158/m.16617 type:complete len:444 (-) Transcript_7158:87-1418(-)